MASEEEDGEEGGAHGDGLPFPLHRHQQHDCVIFLYRSWAKTYVSTRQSQTRSGLCRWRWTDHGRQAATKPSGGRACRRGRRRRTYLVVALEDGAHDVDEAHVGGEVDDAEQALELLQRHDDGSAAHEAGQRRLGQEVHDEAQPAMNGSRSMEQY